MNSNVKALWALIILVTSILFIMIGWRNPAAFIMGMLPYALIGGIYIVFYLNQSKKNKTRIREEIKRLGGRNILISTQFFDGQNFVYSYTVFFDTPTGRTHRIKCKVSDDTLCWTHSPSEFLRQSVEANIRPAHIPKTFPHSNKEILIDKLHSPYKQERVTTAKEIRQIQNVDEQVIHLLRELVFSDPEEEVRKAAKSTLAALNRELI